MPLTLLAAIIAVSAAAWSYFNRQPELNERDTILLTDFENKTGQEAFSGMLKQALAIQLQQSSFLTLFPDSRVQHTLQLMTRPPDERVTAQIGREICQRQGIKALITGSIAPLGSHYVITLEAINAQNGETLAHHQANAEGAEQVLQALTLAATQLRQQLGGLLRSIQKSNPVDQLDQLRTSKLEALKNAVQARDLSVQGRYAEAILFGKRAVEIDPKFNIALMRLAIWYSATGQPESAAKYAEQAFLLRDETNEFEKLDVTIWYHLLVTGNQNKWFEALRLQKEAYPSFVFAYHNLALGYNSVGQFEQAVAEERELLRREPSAAAAAPPYRALSFALVRLNRFAEAKETIGKALQRKLLETDYLLRLYELAFIEGDRVEMQRQVDAMSGRSEEYAALDWQTDAAAFTGQWRQAQKLSREAIDLATRVEMHEAAWRYRTDQALHGALFGDCQLSRANVTQALKLERGRATLPRAALALALCGEANQVKPLIDELTKRYPQDTMINSTWLPVIRAALELQRGNAKQAIEELQPALRYQAAAEFWPQYLRGQALLQLKQGEAAVEFQEILSHRGQAPLSPLYPLAYLGLARAAALTGDIAQSRKAYEDFFAVWNDADSDLPVLRAAKHEVAPQ